MRANNINFTEDEFTAMKRDLEALGFKAFIRKLSDVLHLDTHNTNDWLRMELGINTATFNRLLSFGAGDYLIQIMAISDRFCMRVCSYQIRATQAIVLARLESAYEYDFTSYKGGNNRTFDHWSPIRKKVRLRETRQNTDGTFA
ncbi:hypothetical protein AB6E53_02425 [Vibrio breoganii]|uniref:Uncharacterized protein n=1 Tax=Vibrio breoganii TaxID=553239 RepID=A0AAP8MVJ8_9VIBR|nr:hypothetical protein [Vibrio breoganii]PMP10244.1 hypothetical protein BCS93_11250 [Vibrio breoganii]